MLGRRSAGVQLAFGRCLVGAWMAFGRPAVGDRSAFGRCAAEIWRSILNLCGSLSGIGCEVLNWLPLKSQLWLLETPLVT